MRLHRRAVEYHELIAGQRRRSELDRSERARGTEPLSPGSYRTLEELQRYGALPGAAKRRSREDAPSNDSAAANRAGEAGHSASTILRIL